MTWTPTIITIDTMHAAVGFSHRLETRFARREFLALAVKSAFAIGVGFVGLFAGQRRASAHTAAGTFSSGCYGPIRTDQALSGSTGCCSCGSNVSSSHCGTDGYHRHHPVVQSGGITVEYRMPRLPSKECRGRVPPPNAQGVWPLAPTFEDRWNWTLVSGSQSAIWRCHDGQKRTCTSGGGCTTWSKSVCPKQL